MPVEVPVDEKKVKIIEDQNKVQYLREEHAAFQEFEIKQSKQWRVELDAVLQKIKTAAGSRERALSITKLQESIMWLGMDLKERAAPNPYPNSYNPQNAIVEPTADGMKM
jgi:hypothetical protein